MARLTAETAPTPAAPSYRSVKGIQRMPPSTENPDRKTIAVVGLGSIGGIIAGLLRAADRHDVVACVRRPLDHLVVERAEGTIDVPLRALTDPQQAMPVDWVLFCTKAQDTPSSAPWLAKLCGADTRIAVLQNGIGHKE